MIKRIVLEQYSGMCEKHRYTVYYNSGRSSVFNCFASSLPRTVSKWLFDFLDAGYKGHVIIKETYKCLGKDVYKDTILYDRGCKECQRKTNP